MNARRAREVAVHHGSRVEMASQTLEQELRDAIRTIPDDGNDDLLRILGELDEAVDAFLKRAGPMLDSLQEELDAGVSA